MSRVILLVIVTTLAFQNSNGDSQSLGSCPNVDPLPGFKMTKFLGLWYVIQKTSTSVDCLAYNITESEKPNTFHITEIEPHNTLVSGLYHEHHTTGELSAANPSEPARLSLDFPFSIGTTKYIVFMTDYDNYAAVFACKKYPLIYKWSAAILSRTPKLNMDFVDSVRTRLSSYNIDPLTLSIVKQNCPAPGSKGTLIKTASNFVDGIEHRVQGINQPPTP